jgi:hypothetical protein
MNVSKEANAAFMSELKRVNPKRYANLIKNMQCAAIAQKTVTAIDSKKCRQCGLVLPEQRKDARFCDRSCKQAAYRERKAA